MSSSRAGRFSAGTSNGGGDSEGSNGLLKPLLTKQKGSGGYAGKAAIGTVQGDIHDIGKNIVIMMLEANGVRHN